MELDDETLSELGFGDQWKKTIEISFELREKKRASDIQRLVEYMKANPLKVKETMRRYNERRMAEAEAAVGRLCSLCRRVITKTDLFLKPDRMSCKKCKHPKEKSK